MIGAAGPRLAGLALAEAFLLVEALGGMMRTRTGTGRVAKGRIDGGERQDGKRNANDVET